MKQARNSYDIILVEGEASLLAVWTQLLEMRGHRVAGYQAASQLLLRREALSGSDLVITDYDLPDLNGVELVKDLRTSEPRLPAIVLTGSREQSVREAVAEIDYCHVLYKPLNITDLEEKLAEILT